MAGLGELPAEYNPRVHGPYFPGRYYGKPDTYFGDVKLGELPAWLGRRSKNPIDWTRAVGRTFWRYHTRWMGVRKGTMAPLFQLMAAGAMFGYITKYDEHQAEKHCKYH